MNKILKLFVGRQLEHIFMVPGLKNSISAYVQLMVACMAFTLLIQIGVLLEDFNFLKVSLSIGPLSLYILLVFYKKLLKSCCCQGNLSYLAITASLLVVVINTVLCTLIVFSDTLSFVSLGPNERSLTYLFTHPLQLFNLLSKHTKLMFSFTSVLLLLNLSIVYLPLYLTQQLQRKRDLFQELNTLLQRIEK